MKYKCDMIRDLIPLCLDKEAAESSEKAVIEHLSECRECMSCYEMLEKEMPQVSSEASESSYAALAGKIRRRRYILAAAVGLLVGLVCYVCLNYASGYRLNPEKAASLSGRLNESSELAASYEWKDDYHLYIYESHASYDVVGVNKRFQGWIRNDNWLNWPKWSLYDTDTGIEMAGDLSLVVYDEGVQLYPVKVYDTAVKTLTVTCGEKTETKDAVTDGVTIFVFDMPDLMPEETTGTACDENGNVLYSLENQDGWWKWVRVSE